MNNILAEFRFARLRRPVSIGASPDARRLCNMVGVNDYVAADVLTHVIHRRRRCTRAAVCPVLGAWNQLYRSPHELATLSRAIRVRLTASGGQREFLWQK